MAIEEPNLKIEKAGDCTESLKQGIAEGDTDIPSEAQFYQ